MSAYGKVSYTETDEVLKETLSQEFETNSVVEEQVNKFETTFKTDKLQELYEEYDKITIDREKLATLSQIKQNAITTEVSFRVKLVMTTIVLVTLLLAFLCVYNITVINTMGGNINYLQEEVSSYEYDLAQAQGIYEKLTDVGNVQTELTNMGFKEVTSSNIVAIDVADKVAVESLTGSTNWFDAFCNFLSQIFG